MQGIRWLAIELLIFFAGLVDAPSTSAASIIVSLWTFFANIEFSLASIQLSYICSLFG